MTIGRKIYLQPGGIVFNGICDLLDAQNGKEILRDSRANTLHFTVRMFERTWALRVTAAAIDESRCEVALEVANEEREMRELAGYVLRRELALLDAMLLIGTPLEVRYG